MTRVEPVRRDRRGRTRFWRAGLAPYAGDTQFVTPLLLDQHARWRDDHPFFRHAAVQHFIAVRDGRDVGRVAAAIDRRHDDVHGGATGMFGWFECEHRQETATALLDAAATWLRERGSDKVRGPLSYSSNGISGLLVEDERAAPPAIDMPHNPAWYAGLLESWGLTPVKDLLAFWVAVPSTPDARLERITRRVRERSGYVLRPIRADRRGFATDVDHVLRIYNEAWEKNWGFVPMTESELRHEARSMRQILEPSLVLFAEHAGDPVAFSLTLPDINRALAQIRGRLWPWSLARLLLARRRIRHGRVVTLGVVPAHRRAGLEIALIMESSVAARALHWKGVECSWVLDDNDLMIAAIERVGGRCDRRFRIYERPICHFGSPRAE